MKVGLYTKYALTHVLLYPGVTLLHYLLGCFARLIVSGRTPVAEAFSGADSHRCIGGIDGHPVLRPLQENGLHPLPGEERVSERAGDGNRLIVRISHPGLQRRARECP